MKIYAFKTGGLIIEVAGETEKLALIIFIKKYWYIIDKYGNLELIGERKTGNK